MTSDMPDTEARTRHIACSGHTYGPVQQAYTGFHYRVCTHCDDAEPRSERRKEDYPGIPERDYR